MLSQERLEEYRRMTPGERLALSLQAMREAWPEAIRRENDARNDAMLKRLSEAEHGRD